MRQILFHAFTIIFLLSLMIPVACSSASSHNPDSGSEDGFDGGKLDGEDSDSGDEFNGDDIDLQCEVTDDCSEGYRCLEGRCVLGWTVTSLPEGWMATLFPTSGRTLAVNSQGDVYITGTFHGEVDFDPGPGVEICSSVGGSDGFLLKLNSSGEYVQTVLFSGTSEEGKLGELSGLAIGPNGDIYVGGVVQQGAIDVDPGPEVIEVQAFAPMQDPPSNGIWAVFILRLGSDAIFKWLHTFAGAVDPWFEYTVDLFGIDVTDNDKVVAAGFYHEIQWSDQSSGPDRIVTSGLAAFARQMTADGMHLWTVGQQTMFDNDFVCPHGFDVARDGDVFIAGTFMSNTPVDFDPGPGEDWRGESGNFIWWLGPDGAYLGAIDGFCRNFAHINAHVSGGLTVGCSFEGEADLDPGIGVEIHTSVDGELDSYIVLLDEGFSLRWSWVSGIAGNDKVTAVTSDESGNIYAALEMVDGSLLVALNPNGEELWRREFPGLVDSMVASSEHGLYIAGVYTHEGDFDPGPGEDVRIPAKAIDTFLTRLTLEGIY